MDPAPTYAPADAQYALLQTTAFLTPCPPAPDFNIVEKGREHTAGGEAANIEDGGRGRGEGHVARRDNTCVGAADS